MKRKVMKRAHELARTIEGDYRARISLSLRQAWKEVKEVELVKLTGTEKQIAWATELKETLKFAKEILDKTDNKQDEFNYKPLIEEGYKKVMEEENAGKVISALKSLQKHRLEIEKTRIEKGNTRSMKEFIIGFYLLLMRGGYIKDDVFRKMF